MVALFGVCKTAVTIERARHGGDSNMFERLLRGRLRRRVMCSGGVSVICAVILHSVLPYYVEYHVVNVFDQRGHESRFVMGISMVFWLTCLGACEISDERRRLLSLFSAPTECVCGVVACVGRGVEVWRLLGQP